MLYNFFAFLLYFILSDWLWNFSVSCLFFFFLLFSKMNFIPTYHLIRFRFTVQQNDVSLGSSHAVYCLHAIMNNWPVARKLQVMFHAMHFSTCYWHINQSYLFCCTQFNTILFCPKQWLILPFLHLFAFFHQFFLSIFFNFHVIIVYLQKPKKLTQNKRKPCRRWLNHSEKRKPHTHRL